MFFFVCCGRVAWAFGNTAPPLFPVVLLHFAGLVPNRKLSEDTHKYG